MAKDKQMLTPAECRRIEKNINEIVKIEGYKALFCPSDRSETMEISERVFDEMDQDRPIREKNREKFEKVVNDNIRIFNKACRAFINADKAGRLFLITEKLEGTGEQMRLCEVFSGLFYGSLGNNELFTRLVSDLTDKNQITTRGRTLPFYSVPNGHLATDYYDFAFNSIAKGSDDITESLDNMVSRFQMHGDNNAVEIECQNINTPGAGVILYMKNNKKNPKKKDGKTPNKQFNGVKFKKEAGRFNANLNITGAQMTSYKRIFTYIKQQFFEQGCFSNVEIDIDDMVAKNIFSQFRDANKCFLDFLEYTSSITILEVDGIVCGSIAFSYKRPPAGKQCHTYIIYITPAIAAAFLGQSRKQITNFPQFGYKLHDGALDLLQYICYLMRQTGQAKLIKDRGHFTITAQSISNKMFLPTLEELGGDHKKEHKYIKGKIKEAVEEINKTSDGLINIVAQVDDKGLNTADFLEKMKYEVDFDMNFALKSINAVNNRQTPTLTKKVTSKRKK